MEIFTHKLNMTFANTDAAKAARQVASDTLKGMVISGYVVNPTELFANSLRTEETTLVSSACCLNANDFMEAAAAVIKAIGASMKDVDFTFDAFGGDTYSESLVDGFCKDGLLTITTTYYPYGYCEYLPCPECGEDVVRLEDYDPSKTYVCPECGEVIDLSEAYEENAPVITKESIAL